MAMSEDRMHELVDRALAEGEKFWKEIGLDYNSEDDDDYIESSIEEDEVDSDFDVSDDEGIESPKRRVKKGKKKGKKKAAKKEVKKQEEESEIKPIFAITRVELNGSGGAGKNVTGDACEGCGESEQSLLPAENHANGTKN